MPSHAARRCARCPRRCSSRRERSSCESVPTPQLLLRPKSVRRAPAASSALSHAVGLHASAAPRRMSWRGSTVSMRTAPRSPGSRPTVAHTPRRWAPAAPTSPTDAERRGRHHERVGGRRRAELDRVGRRVVRVGLEEEEAAAAQHEPAASTPSRAPRASRASAPPRGSRRRPRAPPRRRRRRRRARLRAARAAIGPRAPLQRRASASGASSLYISADSTAASEKVGSAARMPPLSAR